MINKHLCAKLYQCAAYSDKRALISLVADVFSDNERLVNALRAQDYPCNILLIRHTF